VSKLQDIFWEADLKGKTKKEEGKGKEIDNV
jgi:hypothetical protein